MGRAFIGLMKLSLQLIVAFVVSLLLFASIIALYFAATDTYVKPLTIVGVINMAAVLFFVFLFTRGILKPLEKIRAVVKRVGRGDFKVRIRFGTNKEVHEFANSINEMIDNLQRSKEHEERVERMKSEFVSLAAHQLRTPLAQAKWTLQLLEDGDLGQLNQEQEDVMRKLVVSNNSMIGLVNDLLNIAKIEEGKYVFRSSNMRLENLVSRVIQLSKDRVHQRRIDVSTEFAKPLSKPVMGDPEKIQLVIQNLVDNAIKYTKEGGFVKVRVHDRPREAEVQVQDNGLGIPHHQQDLVFEKFFRGKNIRTVETEGTGLGLFLAKNIVQAHKGKIWFESKEGKGTTFHFTIPRT